MNYKLAHLICHLIGHKFTHLIGHKFTDYYGACERCKLEGDDFMWIEPTIPEKAAYYRIHFKHYFRRVWFTRNFFRCDMCGKRFCKRPDDATHIPF